MGDWKTLEELEDELDASIASEARRAALREKEHQRQLAVLRRRAGIAAVIVVLGIVAIFLILMASLSNPPSTPLALPEDEPPESWATDAADAGVDAIARPMPGAAFKGQKKPPCTLEQRAILEACWVEVARRPLEDHCGREFFEHEGRCYLPVREAERPPTSMEP